MIDYGQLRTAMGELEEDTVVEMLETLMVSCPEDAEKAMEACQEGMNTVGGLFEKGEYYVGDLIFAGELMTQAVNILKPALVGSQNAQGSGRLILCTVEGDLHDIGKNIVRAMLEAAGFQVLDLGIDTKPETIIQTAKEEDIHIIALSGVLTLALDSMKNTIEKLSAAGMRQDVKVIIGGAPVTAESQTFTGADAWSANPQQTVRLCREWAQS